ncbi:MAG: hypothetical protein HFI38_05880 [Lachnospiraceae bacterium]|jgi:hypothetical protein|nr:hypothetical protein [Lachnospiraceae bacterium]
MEKYVTLILALMVIVTAATWLLRRHFSMQLYLAVSKEDAAGAARVLDHPLFRMVFSGYEYLSLRIGAAVELQAKAMLDQCCLRQKSVIMKKEQRESMLFRLAACYVDWGDKEKVEELSAQLKETGSTKALAIIDRLYHIYILKDDCYLSEMEQEFQAATDPARQRELAAYLAAQYENRGDGKEALRYLDYIKSKGKEKEKC